MTVSLVIGFILQIDFGIEAISGYLGQDGIKG